MSIQRSRTEGPTLWVVDLERRSFLRLTDSGVNIRPVWSPDGDFLYFASDRSGGVFEPYVQPADGSGEATKLAVGYRTITSVTHDGERAIIRSVREGTGEDIGMLELDGSQEPVALLATPANETLGRLSPDEQWLAYVSDEGGRDEVYVRPFPELDRRFIISTNGGDEPRWSRDGRELFYLEGRRMMTVAIETDPTFSAGRPETLFELDWIQPTTSFDVAADGRFVLIRDETPGGHFDRGGLELGQAARTLTPALKANPGDSVWQTAVRCATLPVWQTATWFR